MLKSSRETKYEIENLGDVIHPVCCGLDIHKTWIYAVILIYNFEKKADSLDNHSCDFIQKKAG